MVDHLTLGTTRFSGTLSVPLFTASLKAKAMATRPS